MRAGDVVAVVAFEGISPFHLSIPSVVMGEDRSEDGIPHYHVRVCAEHGGPIATNAGYGLSTDHGLEGLDDAGMVIVPSWRDPAELPPGRLVDALRRAHARGAKVVGLCLGAFVLAACGLLDGRRATTHWRHAADLARRYPLIQVDASVLWVDHGDVVTSAGTAAAIDCCLNLVRQDHGAAVAARLARRLVMAPHRSGSQAQFIEHPLPVAQSALEEVILWMRGNLERPLRLDELAGRAHVSRRTFTRAFRAATGSSPGQWILSLRLGLARELLETTDCSIAQVAERSGLGTSASLQQHFRRSFNTTPGAYRRAFGRRRPPLPGA